MKTPPIQVRWRDIEYFDEAWKSRISQMSGFIPNGHTVLDLGCGKQWLKDLVGSERYTGVDYRARSSDCIVCNFNMHEFPNLERDVAFVSGCLEYIEDYKWFIERVCRQTRMCILSYCTLGHHSDLESRRSVGWVNDLTVDNLVSEFAKGGHKLVVHTETPTRNTILVFSKSQVD